MTHEERVWHHEMETCEGIHEHAERIAKMEEFLLELFSDIEPRCLAMDKSCSECDLFAQDDKCLAERLAEHMDDIGIEWRKGLER